MKLKKQQFVEAKLGLVDAVTLQPIEATFSDVTLTSSDESIFIIKDADGDGDPDLEGIGSGTAKLKVSAVVTWFDNNGEKHVDGKEADVDITVEFDAQTTKLVVSFTDPADIPANTTASTAADNNGAGTKVDNANASEQLQTGSQQQPAAELNTQDAGTTDQQQSAEKSGPDSGPGPDQQNQEQQ